MCRKAMPLCLLLLVLAIPAHAQQVQCPGCDCKYPPYTPQCAPCCLKLMGETGAALAEETPKIELSMAYSYVRFTPGTGIDGINLNGGSGAIALNVNSLLGIVADFGGYRLSNLTLTGLPSVRADGTLYTYLFGPRLSYRHHRAVTPFAQVLFGGAHRTDLTVTGVVVAHSENAFAMTAGGGFDIKVRPHVAIRLIQAEYLLTRFKDLASPTGPRITRNNARISAGIVFYFGGK